MLAALRRNNFSRAVCSADELEDLASATAMDLMSRAETGDWDPSGREPAEVLAYLRTAARHGLSAAARRQRRLLVCDHRTGEVFESSADNQQREAGRALPEARVETREFADALLDCVNRMRPRSQRIWFMRAVLDLDTRSIAQHPGVQLSEANVDVILTRARHHLRDCLGKKGFSSEHLPAGTFAELWAEIARAARPAPPDSAEISFGVHETPGRVD